MAEQKKMVEAITSMDVDFAKWYTDVVRKADLADYSSGAPSSGLTAVQSGKISGIFWMACLKKPAMKM